MLFRPTLLLLLAPLLWPGSGGLVLVEKGGRHPHVLEARDASGAVRSTWIADHVLAKLRPGTDPASLGFPLRERLSSPGLVLLEVPLDRVRADLERGVDPTASAIAELRARPEVLYAEPDFVMELLGVPNDPRYAQQWGMTAIGGPAAWDVHTGSATVRVAVLDTGCDYNHADLAGNLWTNAGETPGNGIDDDGNGYVDDVRGWDFGDGDPDPMDPFGHGTHVTGILGAIGNNALGVTGVCWDVEIVVVKVVTSSWGVPVSSAVQGIDYARWAGAKLTSNSWGVGAWSQSLHDAIAASEAAGGLFIAAAGNSAADTDAAPIYPSCDTLDSIITVAATTSADGRWTSTNYGATSVDLGAPGVDVHSTFPMGLYYNMTGTSMAAPHVAGACALVWAAYPTLTAAQVKARVLSSADPLPELSGYCVTGGRLDLAGALAGSDPAVAITVPGADGTTSSTVAALEGTASDADGGVATVTWLNVATGATGTASGTATWSATVPLAVGENRIEVTATDDQGQVATAVRTIERTSPAPPPTPASGGSSGGGGKCGSVGLDLLLPLGLLWAFRRIRASASTSRRARRASRGPARA